MNLKSVLALLYAPSVYHLVFCWFCWFSRTSLLWGLSLTYSLVRLLTCLLGFTRLSDKLADELTEKLLILKPESLLLDGTHGFCRRGTHLYYVFGLILTAFSFLFLFLIGPMLFISFLLFTNHYYATIIPGIFLILQKFL